MTRYCINATVEVDAWTYLAAETEEDAREQAASFRATDFELGDPLDVTIRSVDEA